MSSSFFDKKHSETINTQSPGEITLYMQTIGFLFLPCEARVIEGEVLTDARGQGSLDRNITIL
jgi:Trp operon repressor